MTMLDDEVLGALLHELGDSYVVPASGIADTLRRVRHGDEERSGPVPGPAEADDGADDGPHDRPQPRTVKGTIRSHRLLSVAASLVLLLALAGGAAVLGRTSPGPKETAGLKPLHRTLPTPTGHGTPRSSAGSTQKSTSAAPANSFSTATGAPGLAAPPTSATPATTSNAALPAGAVGEPARIEETGSLDLTVARGALTPTMNKLTSLASAYGGFVASSQTQANSSDGSPPSGTVTLQVPVADFSALLTQAKSLGKTSSLTTKATDVTGQYVDLQSRITALEASRQQYLTIMAKASSIGDVLAVQAQLDNLQSQIEQLQGQLGVLQSETDYSTLVVSVGEAGTHHHHSPAPAVSGIAKAWHDSLHGFAVGIDGIVRLAGPALFALLCLVALVLGGRFTWRRLQRHSL
jgi:hypothetical protein